MTDADVIYVRDLLDEDVLYPDSDGQPMSDNTLQFDWISTLKGNFDLLFADRSDVFVAGDNLWYPVRGKPKERLAPDVYVVFGRPKGYRGSYRQWVEGGVPLTVVMEVLSPRNTYAEMDTKRGFYDRHGADEFIILDPAPASLGVEAWVRGAGGMARAARLQAPADGAWTSPRLGVTFAVGAETLEVVGPDGEVFRSFLETGQRGRAAQQEAARANRQAERSEAKAAAEKARADALAERLRELGVDPDRP